MTIANPALTGFLNALTAIDQIPASERAAHNRRERRDDRRELYRVRYRKWIAAEVAYHRAYAAQYASLGARTAGIGDKAKLEAGERAAGAMLLALIDDLMAVPIVNEGDRQQRKVLIRKCGKAIATAGTWSQWLAAEQRWLAQIGSAS